jgi:hypothetical protein
MATPLRLSIFRRRERGREMAKAKNVIRTILR